LDYHPVIENSYQLLTILAITPAATTILASILVVLFVLSFLFSGSEMAFFSLSLKDINMLKTRQQPSYKRIIALLENPKILMASLLISNCLVNIGIILILNSLMNEWINTLGLNVIINMLIKVVVITCALVLFCEVLPKVWATHHKIWFASTASMTVDVFNNILFKLSKRVVSFGDSIEKTFHSRSTKMDDSQIDNAIDLLPDNKATNEEKQILKEGLKQAKEVVGGNGNNGVSGEIYS